MANGAPSDAIERRGVLFGYPLKHSLSPVLHNASFKAMGLPWEYTQMESKEIPDFLRILHHPSCYGEKRHQLGFH